MGNSYADIDYHPLYPFGFGLSYTSFEYSNLQVSPESHGPFGTFTIDLDVKNVGAVAGSEVVQLYIRDKISSVVRPVKELKGFAKIRLEAGESKTVYFQLGPGELRMLDRNMSWTVESGEFEILVGSSSEDIRLEGLLTIR